MLVLLLLLTAGLIVVMFFVGLMELVDYGTYLSIILIKPVSNLPSDETKSLSKSSVDSHPEDLSQFFYFTILWIKNHTDLF